MKNQIDTEWKVSDSDDKSFAVETTIKRARTSMKSPFMNVDYDSEKEEPKDPVGKQLATSIKQVLGIPILMKIGRQGNLLEMKLPESIQKLGSDSTGPIPTRSLESFFTSSQQLQIPEGEMTIGRKWEQTIKSNDNGMQTKANVTYRYEGAVEEGGRKLAKFTPMPQRSWCSHPRESNCLLRMLVAKGRFSSTSNSDALAKRFKGKSTD